MRHVTEHCPTVSKPKKKLKKKKMAQLRQNLKIMKLTELCRNTFQQRVKERDRS